MSVVVVGIEHQQAPLDLLERVTVPDHDLPKVLAALRDGSNVQECVVLSTCLRTEVYAVVDRFHEAVSELHDFLAARAGVPVAVIEGHSTVRFDDDVALHLFCVAAGLESAVLGESEVLGQVRRAWERAHVERACGPVLEELFRHAVGAGKRARAETRIARGATSFAHAAVALAARQRGGGLGGTTVAVVGAGDMGGGIARALVALPEGRRPAEVVVVNRTLSRAEALAGSLGAPPAVRAAGIESLTDVVASADVVVVAVGSEGHVLGPAGLAASGPRTSRPVLVVDLGVPRTVDPAAAAVGGVTLLDMDDLRVAVAQAVDERRSEAESARALVVADLARYRAASRARGAAPVIAALRTRLETLRDAELDRHRGQLADLPDEAWARVDAVTRSVLAKLLHEPTVHLRETSGTPRGERLVEALRTLFDL